MRDKVGLANTRTHLNIVEEEDMLTSAQRCAMQRVQGQDEMTEEGSGVCYLYDEEDKDRPSTRWPHNLRGKSFKKGIS